MAERLGQKVKRFGRLGLKAGVVVGQFLVLSTLRMNTKNKRTLNLVEQEINLLMTYNLSR